MTPTPPDTLANRLRNVSSLEGPRRCSTDSSSRACSISLRNAGSTSTCENPSSMSRRAESTRYAKGAAVSPSTNVVKPALPPSKAVTVSDMGSRSEIATNVPLPFKRAVRFTNARNAAGRSLRCSSAAPSCSARSCPFAGRCSGSFARQRSTIAASLRGTASPSDASCGAGSVTCFASTSVALRPSNGNRPENAKNALAPSP